MIEQYFLPIWPTLFWIVAAILAAFIIVLETATNRSDPSSVMRTKEWWILWGINTAIAFILIYGAKLADRISIGYAGFFAAIFGYSILLHAKIFTIRGADRQDDASVGPEYVLTLFDKLLQKNIDRSLIEQRSELLVNWRNRSSTSFQKLVQVSQDYLASSSSNAKDSQWMDSLLTDAKANPNKYR